MYNLNSKKLFQRQSIAKLLLSSTSLQHRDQLQARNASSDFLAAAGYILSAYLHMAVFIG
jgi:hypothetical protein